MSVTVPDEVLLARAYLSRVGEPADVRLWRFVDRAGAVTAARALRAGIAEPKLLAATEARRDVADPEADLAAADRHGIRLVVPESPEWPHFAFAPLERLGSRRAAQLDQAGFHRNVSGEPMPPLALWVRGDRVDLATCAVRSVALVGARAATPYGEHVTADLAFGLAGRDFVVVSGGAYGIDAAAHRAALAARGSTVIVSAGGLDRPYPSGNAALFERAAADGLLISESPPGCAPQRSRFLTRNRLIAALSSGVVVVEASSRSGATNTAGHARALGRPLMAVPGPVTSAMSVGCHALLAQQPDPAILVTGVEDVLGAIGRMGEADDAMTARRDVPEGAGADSDADADPAGAGLRLRAELDGLDPGPRSVFEGLRAGRYAAPEEVASRCGVAVTQVIRALPVLDLAGLLETRDGEYRVSRRVRAVAASARAARSGTGP